MSDYSGSTSGKIPAHIRAIHKWRGWSGPAKLGYTVSLGVAVAAIVLAFTAYWALLSTPPGPNPVDPSQMLIVGGAAASQPAVADVIAAQVVEATEGAKEETLKDETKVKMPAGTKMVVVLSSKERNVHLLNNEALFKVAKDPLRPFSVVTKNLIATAVGTQFRVHTGECEWVKVEEGIVRVSYKGGKLMLKAGGSMDVPRNCSKSRKL